MKILVFSDMHSNIYALEQLLQTQDYKDSDLKIALGDYVVMGPRPNETMQKMLEQDCIKLIGNNDSYVANFLPQDEVQAMPLDRQQHIEYVRNILNPEYIDVLKNLPYEYVYKTKHHTLYFTHYAWEDKFNVKDCPITPTSQDLYQAFGDIKADYVFFGHKHEPVGGKINNTTYVGVGSLGMSYPANYVVVDIDNDDNITIIRKQLDYDFDSMRQDMLDQNYVCANTFLNFFNK